MNDVNLTPHSNSAALSSPRDRDQQTIQFTNLSLPRAQKRFDVRSHAVVCHPNLSPKDLEDLRQATMLAVIQELSFNSIGLAFQDVKYLTEQNYIPINGFTTNQIPQNHQKYLRYPDAFPWDHNCIDPNYFMDASRVTVGERQYIASEAPLPVNFYRFWKMIWEDSNQVIVNLTEISEDGKLKAHCYWPKKDSFTFEPFDDDLEKPLTVAFVKKKKYCKTAKKTQHIVKYTFNLQSEGKEKKAVLLHYRHLEDMKTPRTPQEAASFFHLLKLIGKAEQNSPMNPTLVQCSAGLGRTGMLLSCLHFGDQIRNHAFEIALDVDFHVGSFMARMRKERQGLVQRECQFQFIKWFVNAYHSSFQAAQ